MNSLTESDYIAKVLGWFEALPETPKMAGASDVTVARRLFEQRVDLEHVRQALLLGSARRLCRDPALGPLRPIGSLAYFLRVISEVIDEDLDNGYVLYLEGIVGDGLGRVA